MPAFVDLCVVAILRPFLDPWDPMGNFIISCFRNSSVANLLGLLIHSFGTAGIGLWNEPLVDDRWVFQQQLSSLPELNVGLKWTPFSTGRAGPQREEATWGVMKVSNQMLG